MVVCLIWILAVSQAEARPGPVLAVSLGWHVGLAFPAADLDPESFPEVADFPDAQWIEVGWGDAAFYRDPDPDMGAVLAAALVPTPAVLHLVAMPTHPARYLPAAEVVAIPLDPAQFARLVAYVSGSVDRGDRPRAESIADGLYPVSRFYPALGSFSLARTCNTWVAQGLAVAGVPIDADGVVRASTLMARIAAALGRRTSPGPGAASDHR